ncbi:MAG: hypothetical protein QOD35_1005 [Nocardioidaceae bacterium]|nr:hypothetical protein [Nocardioidaceae bacterium]
MTSVPRDLPRRLVADDADLAHQVLYQRLRIEPRHRAEAVNRCPTRSRAR